MPALPQFLGDVRGQRRRHQDQRLGQGAGHALQPDACAVNSMIKRLEGSAMLRFWLL
jgi:hypothetical protein